MMASSLDAYRTCYTVFELLIVLGLTVIFTGYIILKRRRSNALNPLPFKSILVSMLFYIG